MAGDRFHCHEPSAAAHEYDLTEMRMAVRLDAPAVGAAAVGQRLHVDEPVAGAARHLSVQVIAGNRCAFGPPDESNCRTWQFRNELGSMA